MSTTLASTETTLYNETGNTTATSSDEDPTETLRLVLAIITTSVIMVGMGCAIEIHTLIERFKKPIGIIIGAFCQWLIMPSLAYAFTRIFNLPGPETLSILIMGSCPGGVTSNVVTYYLDGDMNLSIAMTSTSILLSLGLIPLLLFLYSKSFSSIGEELTVPFSALGISVATLVIPLAIGGFIRWKFPKKSKIILKIGAIIGALAAVGGAIAAIIFYKGAWSITVGQIIAAIFLPLCGMLSSYGISTLVSLHKKFYLRHFQRRTISIETGIQNSSIGLGIIQLSGWSVEVGAKMILLPLGYVISQLFWAGLFVLGRYIYTRKIRTSQVNPPEPDNQENVPTISIISVAPVKEEGFTNPMYTGDDGPLDVIAEKNLRDLQVTSTGNGHTNAYYEGSITPPPSYTSGDDVASSSNGDSNLQFTNKLYDEFNK